MSSYTTMPHTMPCQIVTCKEEGKDYYFGTCQKHYDRIYKHYYQILTELPGQDIRIFLKIASANILAYKRC